MRDIKFSEAICEALDQKLTEDPSVYIIGQGVPDNTQTYGTTQGIIDKHGSNRIFEMPLSEAAMAGIVLGSSLVGMKPVMTMARVEFAMLAMDPIANQAAKWFFMFGGQANVPLTLRLIVGRGWGQGPQHSQSLHSWFSHIPGLKVVMPSTPYDAKGLLMASIDDPDPVIFIEHRWLHYTFGNVPKDPYKVPLGVPVFLERGEHVTIVASSYMAIEAMRALKTLKEDHNISVDIIDLRTLNPLNDTIIMESVQKTGRLLVCDHAYMSAGFAGEIISRVCEKLYDKLKAAPVRITLPDAPTPTTFALADYYYPTHWHIVSAIQKMMGLEAKDPWKSVPKGTVLDIPNHSFSGPF